MFYARYEGAGGEQVFAAPSMDEIDLWREFELPVGARPAVRDQAHILSWPSMGEFWRWLQAEIGLSRLQDLDEKHLMELCRFYDHFDEGRHRVVISWVLSFAHDTKQTLRELTAKADLTRGKIVFPCWFFGWPLSDLDPVTRRLKFQAFKRPAVVWVVWGRPKPPRNDLQLAASCEAVWWTKNGALKLAAGLWDPIENRTINKNDITYAASNPANFRRLTRLERAELPNYVPRP